MPIEFLLRGFLIGFSIAIPVGPVGILCVRRTLAEGQIIGFASGLGAATADSLYGAVAAFGLTFISNFLVDHQTWFRLVGGTILCYFGVKLFWSHLTENSEQPQKKNTVGSAYFSTLALTLTNPATLLAYAAIFAGLGMGNVTDSHSRALALVGGVFGGSAAWWLTLSAGVNLLRARCNPERLTLVNRLAGALLLCFGLVAVSSFWI